MDSLLSRFVVAEVLHQPLRLRKSGNEKGGPTLWLFMNALMSLENELLADFLVSALILPLRLSK
ncbi:hypothetical protein [Shinella kummerowiae]|jgi:hypothetical protein|uniref:hypothetical protein n=1 Tax=Shinella kummerowiae TaxID=417745 RepID=UPI0021B5E023|nr:hypothetical protein [Shinella kummerowiae]MCT7662701.1 hypothetical protein [Shinella kummerowiae]